MMLYFMVDFVPLCYTSINLKMTTIASVCVCVFFYHTYISVLAQL